MVALVGCGAIHLTPPQFLARGKVKGEHNEGILDHGSTGPPPATPALLAGLGLGSLLEGNRSREVDHPLPHDR